MNFNRTFLSGAALILFAALTMAFSKFNGFIGNYNLTSPDFKAELSDSLREVSDITILDTEHVACIQDENGIVFVYNLKKNNLVKRHSFNFDGDYEGLAKANQNLYILRSDGALFEITNFGSSTASVNYFPTPNASRNNEGLCFDADHNRLLIAVKESAAQAEEYRNKRLVYAFDLKLKQFSTKPAYTFDMNEIYAYAKTHNIEGAKKKNKEGEYKTEPLQIAPSAISIHPGTKNIFIVSAKDHALLAFNRSGKLLGIQKLNENLFNKPEGLAFFQNGDMLITNEGKDKPATLLRFNRKK